MEVRDKIESITINRFLLNITARLYEEKYMGILGRLKNSKAKKYYGEEKSYLSKTFILCAEEDYIRIMNVICDGSWNKL